MKIMKKVASIFLVTLFMASALFAQGSAEGSSGNAPIKLAYVSMNLANPWNTAVKNGFEAACKELGVEYTTIDSQSGSG